MTSDDVDAAAQAIARMEQSGGVTAWRLGGEFCGVRWAERQRVVALFKAIFDEHQDGWSTGRLATEELLAMLEREP